MTIPKHWVHIYQRPAQGSNFIGRFEAFDYQHTITNMGWFDTASCSIAMNKSSGQRFVESIVGSFVAIYVDNPFKPIWEGIINRITFNAGGASYTISLEEMANRFSVVYTAGANVGTQGVVANYVPSQNLYGIKQEQVEFGTDPSAPAASQRGNLRDTLLAQKALPLSSITQAQGQANLIQLELIGIFHTLEWEKNFTATATTNTAANTKITNFLAALANGATFFNNADTSQVASSGITIPDQQRGVSTWELFQKIAEAGDGTNYWIVGITPTNWNTKKRVLYYRQANFNANYRAYQSDMLRVRNQYGKIIYPWLVEPDQVIRVIDFNIGITPSVTGDPRAVYIQQIQYNANTQQVQWYGTDDTTARAAFQLKRMYKPLSRQFGAPLRTIVT